MSMTDRAEAAVAKGATEIKPDTGDAAAGSRLAGRLHLVALSVGPLFAALLIASAILLLMGVNPVSYYTFIVNRGLLSPSGIEATLTRMGPLLLTAASLIVAFRTGIWNLGGDAQFLLGAVFLAAMAPALAAFMPVWLVLVVTLLVGAVAGALWSVVPALLRAYQGVNEIITTMMMTFLGISFANVLVKIFFLDPATTVPQTRTLPVEDRLPRLFDTTISSGLLIGLAAILLVHFVMAKTAFGLKLRIVGANQKAAVHAGLPVAALTVAVFAISAGFAGLSGAVAVLGQYGNVRADWNPAYTLTIVPLVFLARFNGFATIAYVFVFSVLSIGSESAARRLGVPNYFTLVTMAILLILLGITEMLDQRRRDRRRA